MRKVFIYILALLALSVSCQRIDLPEELPTDKPVDAGMVGRKVTITFSTAELINTETKAIIDPEIDVETLHLILFDENGMYVETCEATKLGSSDHDGHAGGRHYTVTLTLTDKPRIIHFVANCPVDQIIYGHEFSVIGNMYVDKNDREYRTQYETSYWARIEVPFILVQETEEQQQDGTTKTVVSLHPDIVHKFNHVPLLRNYAEITVTDKTNDTFKFLGYTVYNILDRGTVAPYNSNANPLGFQNFIYHPDPTKEDVLPYLYPELTNLGYEGHFLTSAELITDYARNDDGTVKVFASNQPFYIYERKVSMMTDEEDKWKESPPHIIIKGQYNHGQTVTDQSPVYYYKVDLVYTDKDAQGHEYIKYYNILRNFNYQFNITDVHDEGYTDIRDAVAGPSGNNLSGSTTTSKLTNVSDNLGRLWVSYTDTTLVNGTIYDADGNALNPISLKYKYMPNYYNAEETATYQKVDNSKVRFVDFVGEVISSISVATDDITEAGQWKDYRNVTLYVKQPSAVSARQTLKLLTDNPQLARDIRYTLRDKFSMQVECTPKVAKSMMQPVTVDIKLPLGLTEDMFPLVLNIETFDRTLSPDPVKNTIPVTIGPSIIDVDGRRGQQSYFYTVTIPTLEVYKGLTTVGDMKLYKTHWNTTKAENASTVYVDNKYFNQASDTWLNYTYTFSNLSCSASDVGVGMDVTIKFSMAQGAYNKPVTISLRGMTYTGTLGSTTYENATELTYTPTGPDVTISGFKTTTVQENVSFVLDAPDYAISDEVIGERNTYKFNGAFVGDVTRLETEAGVEADFTFDIPADAYHDDMAVYVTLNRLVPADDEENLEYVIQRSVGDKYLYRVQGAGTQTIRLATAEATEGLCTVTLESYAFEAQVVEVEQRGLRFRNLTIPEQVAIGTGRSVDISFMLDAEDGNSVSRNVTVTLVNMARNSSSTFTINTANTSGNNADVTNNNGIYTIRNVVTADVADGELKVTLSANGYADITTICSNRTPAEKTGTISFAIASQRISRDNSKQVWQNDGITLTNEKGSGNNVTNNTNPVRFLQNQKLVIEAGGNEIVKIVFNVDDNSSEYPNRLKESISDATVTVLDYTVTVTLNGSTKFEIAKLRGNIQLDSMSVTYKE